MAKDSRQLAEVLKLKGLSCGKLKSLEKDKLGDAKKFRSVGLNKQAQKEENSARGIRQLRKSVCLLK